MSGEIPKILTIEEASVYLRIPLSSLYKLAQNGKVPCQKVGRHWRFRKESIDLWLDERMVLDKQKSAQTEENHGS